MRVYIDENKLVIIAVPKTIHFDLPRDVAKYLKHEIHYIIKHNEFLAKHKWKTRLVNYCPHTKMETIFMNIENSKMN